MEPHDTDPIAVRTAAEADALLRPRFERARREKIAVLHLRADGALLHVSLYSGNLDEAEVPVRRILRQALRFGSEALILAHNHPSGDPRPSGADRDATAYFAETAGRLGIEVRDHLIFAGDGCASFRELGLL